MSSALKSACASIVSLTVVTGLAVSAAAPAASAAAAPDTATAAVTDFLDRLATDFVPQVASGTALSEQLPTVAVTPAESVGLRTAFGDLLAPGGRLENITAQPTLAALASYVDGADGGEWTFAASATGSTVTIGYTRVRKQKAGLDIRDEDGTISLSSGGGIDVTGTLTGSFTLVYDPTAEVASLTDPSMEIRTTADLPAGVEIPAGLGILGVQVVGADGTDDYQLSSTVTTAWANPDNDPLGALAFDNPATPEVDDGELAADGAGAGLVTATRTGSLSGTLEATPRPSSLVSGLPEVGATLTLSSASPATFETPSVTADVPEEAEPFLTLTPRDLAAGLSQAASAIIGMQDAGDGNLPLMRGSIGNAIDAVGGIKAFLADQVVDNDVNDDTPGQPKFASLQDMLTALDTASYDSGWSIDVLDEEGDAATFDPDDLVASFTIRTTRDGVSDLELNPLGAATTGTGTFSATGLSASGVDFNGPQGTAGAELVGRKVQAGMSYGTIATIVDGNTLTLTADGWSAGTPAKDTVFSIEAADPKTGAPELADVLEETTGIAAANADLSTATITPDVVVTLPMALDLSAPLTFAGDPTTLDCDPGPGEATCPFQQVDESGLGRVITSLPLAADRVMLRQSARDVLVADAAITSPVQIGTTSGYLGLSIGGNVTVSVPDDEHLQVLSLTGTGDIPVPAFVEEVRKQAVGEGDPVFDQQLGGSVEAALVVDVDDAPDAFGEGEDSTDLTVSGSVADLADGIDDGDVAVDAAEPARAELLAALDFDDKNPLALFAGVQGALEGAGTDLTTMTGGGLDTPIPLIGSSVSQLVGAGASGGAGVTYAQEAGVAATDGPPATQAVPATTVLTDPGATFDGAFVGRRIVIGSTVATIVAQTSTSLSLAPQLSVVPETGTPYLVENELLGAVHVLQAMTPATLQETLAIAQSSLGNDSTLDFGLVADEDGAAQLRLDMTWERGYGVSRPVSLELPGDQEVIGAGAGGELSIDVSGTVKLRLLLPLTTDAMEEPLDNTRVDESWSEVGLGVVAAAEDAHIGANLGPFSVDLGTEADPGTIHAGFGVTATGATGEDTPSIGDFFTGGFAVGLDNAGADCEGTKDILCAEFPVFVSGTPTGSPLTVVTTLGDGDDLAAVFGGSATKVTPPDELASILEGKPFEFGSLADGLKQYLFYAEVSMRTASNGGEMPVIGKDLQAGADFIGETRASVDAFIEAEGDISLVGDGREYLTKTLSEELGIVVGGESGILVDFTCNSFLEPPAAPGVVPTTATPAPSTTQQYLYKVVSVFKDKANVSHESVASEPTTVTNATTLGTASYNTVTWDRSAAVTSYKVLRATQTTAAAAGSTPVTSAYVVVATPANPTTDVATVSFKDTGAAGTPYTAPPVSAKPYRMPGVQCDDDDSVTEIEGVTLALKLGQGNIDRRWGCKDEGAVEPCLQADLPVDLGLPGLSLRTGESGGITGKVGWALDIKVGMSRSSGFYIDTSDVDELEVGAQLSLLPAAGADMTAQLSVIDVDVEKNTTTPEFVGHFGIDLRDTNDQDKLLRISEIPGLKVSEAIVVSVNAKVDVNWHLAASADAALPGVSTDFKLVWEWGKSTAATPPTTPKPTNPRSPSGLTVKFDKVTLNAGEFFGDALKPYLEQLVDATKPLQPVIDTIFTPMPVISDLSKAAGGKEVTIASLAETFNTLPQGPQIKPFLDAIKTIKALTAVKCTEATCGVEIGSFDLSPGRVATTSASAASATSMIGTKSADTTAASNAIAAKDSSGGLSEKGTGASRLAALKKVISIPVIEDPTILFDLISGGDIALVEFDSGPLAIGFQFQKSFGPIYAPPPVMMVIGGGASVTLRIAAGFDTYGIRRAMETGDGAEVLDSLYFKTVDANGKPIPVVQFTGYLEAGASVSIGILEVGVKGGIKLTVGFYWNDPNNDGKFRLYEFSGAVANNPICLFNVGGELSLYVKVFVVIGFSPFSVDFDFTLVNIKLLDFNLKPDCTPPPPRLGGTNGSVLYVFAGKFGGSGPRGDAAWDAKMTKDETWVVRQVPAYEETVDGVKVQRDAVVEVRGLGITESFPDTATSPITTVVLDGRGYGGALTVSFTGGQSPSFTDAEPPVADGKTEPFTKTAVVVTGAGADNIRTGEGDSWVDSGAGNDQVTTADRVDLSTPVDDVSAHVAGGPGADVITVGNGNDTVTGDGALDLKELGNVTVNLAPAKAGTTVLANPVDAGRLTVLTREQLAGPTTGDGPDQIAAGLGSVILAGNGGNDTVGTANDSTLADSSGIKAGTTGGSADEEALYRAHPSVLIGGAGGDVMKSGSADDEVYTGSYGAIGESATGAGDVASDVNVVDTGTGSDTVYGSNGHDFVTTASRTSQSSQVYGGGGTDVLTGGLGSDELYGGPDDDYLVASPATVGEPGSASDVLGSARLVGVLPGGGTSTKKLVGGTGSDRIYGSDGPSTIFGDTTADGCAVQSDPVSKQPGESGVAGDAADLILGGTGVDVVNAGGGDDWVYASGASDRVCGNAGTDRLYAGDGDDLVQGGSGPDQGFGEAGVDQVYGNEGDDSLYGSAGTDRLQGNSGADWVDGGSEADVLLGGTSKAGSADGADVLLGAEGVDRMVGDNAQSDVLADAPYPTDLGSADATRGGNDYLVGGDDDDIIYGGLGADTAYAGDGDDLVEGNPGADTLAGEAGDDDLVGGSSELASGRFAGSEPGRPDTADTIDGGVGQDVIAGDNASVSRLGTAHPLMTGRVTSRRSVDLADEGAGNAAGTSGGDDLRGGDGNDIVFGQRGADLVSLGNDTDYGEGGPDADTVRGDAGDDDVVGGSFTPVTGAVLTSVGQPDAGDTLAGDAGQDVVLGDNAAVTRFASTGASTTTAGASAGASAGTALTGGRVAVARSITPYDLGDSPTAGTSAADTITGDADNDVLLGQGGDDRVDAGSGADYAEGGQGSDLVLGGTEDDDLAGGSSTTTVKANGSDAGQPDASDNVQGGSGSDLAIGDNGLLTRVDGGRDWRTNRAAATQGALVPGRAIALFDLNSSTPLETTSTHAAADSISGQSGADVLLGQDGDDWISGGGNDDYVEGEGGADAIHGDLALTVDEILPAPAGSVWSTPAVDGELVSVGQDDLTGGSSRAGFRDGADAITGDGDHDFVVGDNGSVARVLDGTTERVYAERYGAKRSVDATAKVRVAGGGATSTRFCKPTGALSQTSTCEVDRAFGKDSLYGDAGQDVLYGQDGDDVIRGGADDDDIYGELGADSLFGEDGEDAILGDRGGVQNRYENGTRSTSTTLQMPPQVTYRSRLDGSVSREADLLHDVNGVDLVDASGTKLVAATSAPMPLDGITYGGVDRIRGGRGHDSIHAGAGADLVNGDAGGDYLFGGRGSDAMWGGQGRECAETDALCQAAPGADGEFVDHLMGGKDEDVLDWRPRGVYGTGSTFAGRTCTTGVVPVTTKKDGTTDPCSWFEMTGRDNDVAGNATSRADNQHHQGIDWVYGGWDRDVMQGDQSANGPNPGDRLIDWSGVYNLYSHCNAAYGGFNDIRIPSPSMESFVQQWATGLGAGRPGDVTVPGSSAYDELALVTNADGKAHGTGSAYPTTPGHFDDAGACSGF